MRRARTLLAAAAALLALAPSLAGACAALFSPDASVRQAAQRIIFAVDRPAGEVTAYVSVNYVGAAESFAWVVPMPSNPKVDVAEAASFTALDDATRPRYLFPAKDCQERFDGALGGGGVGAAPPGAPGGVDVYQQSQVGPYDFAVVGGDDAGALTQWLRDNDYRITQEMEPLIKAYTDERMLFLAMKLQGGKEAGDITPVKMTFKAAKPTIPLRLAAVGAQPDTQLLVWVFDDAQSSPENLARVVVPDDDVVVSDWYGGSTYEDAVRGALAGAGGHALVVEYALPTERLDAGGDSLLAELKARHPFLTRFRGQMSPEQMTLDPSFAPDSQAAPVSNVHDLRGRISPYDCDARDVLSPEEQRAPAGSPGGIWIQTRGWIAPAGAILAVLVVGAVGVWAARGRRPR